MPFTPMPHQITDAAFLASRAFAGCFNGMGTGKTRTALMAVDQVNADRVVIVGPPISLHMWQAEAEDHLAAATSDLILLDIMLPGMTGLEVCRTMKSDPVLASVPVLMLTAKSDVKDRVKGLELGAEDYVTKPFSPKEVVLRVQALLKRLRSGSAVGTTLES